MILLASVSPLFTSKLAGLAVLLAATGALRFGAWLERRSTCIRDTRAQRDLHGT